MGIRVIEQGVGERRDKTRVVGLLNGECGIVEFLIYGFAIEDVEQWGDGIDSGRCEEFCGTSSYELTKAAVLKDGEKGSFEARPAVMVDFNGGLYVHKKRISASEEFKDAALAAKSHRAFGPSQFTVGQRGSACYHREFMWFSHIDGYVCLTCCSAVPEPASERGALRCPDGHLVDGVKSGPLWATGVNSYFKALLPLAVAATVLQSNWLIWVALGGFAAWSIYLFALGFLLPRDRAEIKTIGAQFMVIGVVRVIAAITAGWYLWSILHFVRSPFWK